MTQAWEWGWPVRILTSFSSPSFRFCRDFLEKPSSSMAVTAAASCAGVNGGANASYVGSGASGGFTAGAASAAICRADGCALLPALPDAASVALSAPCVPRRKLARTICSSAGVRKRRRRQEATERLLRATRRRSGPYAPAPDFHAPPPLLRERRSPVAEDLCTHCEAERPCLDQVSRTLRKLACSGSSVAAVRHPGRHEHPRHVGPGEPPSRRPPRPI